MGERTAEDWGRIAVGLPGAPACWSDLDGVDGHDAPGAICADGTWWLPDSADGMYLDVDHPATAGCLLALLLGPGVKHVIPTIHQRTGSASVEIDGASNLDMVTVRHLPSLGRACIAAAEVLGRWPGGAS